MILFISDAMTLREHYHIVGTLVGTLPRHPNQNIQLGLPLQLMPEELVLLLAKGTLFYLPSSLFSLSLLSYMKVYGIEQ